MAAEEFRYVLDIARDLDLRIDQGNALTGLGEACQRLSQTLPAMKALLKTPIKCSPDSSPMKDLPTHRCS